MPLRVFKMYTIVSARSTLFLMVHSIELIMNNTIINTLCTLHIHLRPLRIKYSTTMEITRGKPMRPQGRIGDKNETLVIHLNHGELGSRTMSRHDRAIKPHRKNGHIMSFERGDELICPKTNVIISTSLLVMSSC